MMSVKSKNIHVLPTDKPSRLGYLTKKGKEVYKDLRLFDRLMPNILDSENQHIYITSDESIKEGDWVLNIEENTILKPSNDEIYDIENSEAKYYEFIKKIILTTDQDLIKDGVQAIDDEFLEWFVKNLSCEKVDVDKAEHGMYKDDVYYKLSNKIFYKIITPKEEQTKCYCGHTTYCDCGPLEEPKQETLKEFPIHNFMSIEPTNKKQQKELESNRIRLGIKNKEEDFVLKCLLSFDWRREVILYEVEKVSFTGNMIDFKVRVKAPHTTVDYCCSNPFNETGWSLERPDFNSRAREIWSQLNRYIKR